MRIAPLADVKARLSAYLEQCEAEGPIVITRNGKAVAVFPVAAEGRCKLGDLTSCNVWMASATIPI